MFQKEQIEKILRQAEQIDFKYELFGAFRHRYKLMPPVRTTFVREVEEKYHFSLPQDYIQFITEVGDGGAGPYYGLYQFGNFLRKGKSPGVEKYWEAYRKSLEKPLILEPMAPDILEECYTISAREYQQNPEKYFVDAGDTDDGWCNQCGFFVLGSLGCEWNFGLVTSGERRGQIFETDNQGDYRFAASSFYEFYQNWLNFLSDTERFQKELEMWRR